MTVKTLSAALLIALVLAAITYSAESSGKEYKNFRDDESVSATTERTRESSGWNQSANFLTRAGSLSVLSIGMVPQIFSAAFTAGIRVADIPGHICSSCLWVGDLMHNLGSTIVASVKETVHWLAIPIRIFRAGLERLPLPDVGGE